MNSRRRLIYQTSAILELFLKDRPLVSIVTPSLNMGDFLEQAILSVKAQSYPNIEHIVVDGGSTDNTLSILRKHESSYNLRWISERDNGPANALNKGVRFSTGEILHILNADDLCLPWSVEVAVENLLRHTDAGSLYGDVVYANMGARYGVLVFNPPMKHLRLHLRKWGLSDPALFLRRRVFDLLGGFSEADNATAMYDLLLRAEQKFRFVRVDEALTLWRQHSGGMSTYLSGTIKRHFERYRARFLQVTGIESDPLYGLRWGRIHSAYLIRFLTAVLQPSSGTDAPWRNIIATRAISTRSLIREVCLTYLPLISYKCIGIEQEYSKGYVNIDLLTERPSSTTL